MKSPAVYIMASQRNGTIYVGVTSGLEDRANVHKQGFLGGFTKMYGVSRLVYYEMHLNMEHAIAREKRLKKWNRAWKLRLIEEMNPDWRDLYDEFWHALLDGPADQPWLDRERDGTTDMSGSPPSRG